MSELKITYYPDKETYILSKEEVKDEWGCTCCTLTDEQREKNIQILNAKSKEKVYISNHLDYFEYFDYPYYFKGSRLKLIDRIKKLVNSIEHNKENTQLTIYYLMILNEFPEKYYYVDVIKDHYNFK